MCLELEQKYGRILTVDWRIGISPDSSLPLAAWVPADLQSVPLALISDLLTAWLWSIDDIFWPSILVLPHQDYPQ